MTGMSERTYAAHSGLWRGAVQKVRNSGQLLLFADDSINASASDARILLRRGSGVGRAQKVKKGTQCRNNP